MEKENVGLLENEYLQNENILQYLEVCSLNNGTGKCLFQICKVCYSFDIETRK